MAGLSPWSPPDWVAAAIELLGRQLRAPDAHALRIRDLRELSDGEAWITAEVAGRRYVLGLRCEPSDRGGVGGPAISLLYLYPEPPVAPSGGAGVPAAEWSSAPATRRRSQQRIEDHP